MSVKWKMTAIADAIREITLKPGELGLDGMITDLASIMEYSLADIEGHLADMTLDEKLTAMADIIRYRTGLTKLLSLYDMATMIAVFPDAVASNGEVLYTDLRKAIAGCESGGTLTLLRDITLENVSSNFVINKAITIDGAKADGSGNYKIEADFGDTAGKLFETTNSAITLTFKNVDIALSGTHNETNIVDSACNVVVENSYLTSSKRVIRISVGDGSLLVTNSTIEGGTVGIGAFGNGERGFTVSNSIIKSDSSAIDLSGGTNTVTVTESIIQSNNFPIRIYRGKQEVVLGDGSKVERIGTNGHAIYAHGIGSDVAIALEKTAKVLGVEDSDIYFTENTARYQVKFAENYSRYAMTAGAMHSEGTGGLAIRFFDNLQDAVENNYGNLFTYRSDVANDFAENGYTVNKETDGFGVKYYYVVQNLE